jgi:hypothetical protein
MTRFPAGFFNELMAESGILMNQISSQLLNFIFSTDQMAPMTTLQEFISRAVQMIFITQADIKKELTGMTYIGSITPGNRCKI